MYLSPSSKHYAWCLACHNPSEERHHSKAMTFACLSFIFRRFYVTLLLTSLPALLSVFLFSAHIFPCLYKVPQHPISPNHLPGVHFNEDLFLTREEFLGSSQTAFQTKSKSLIHQRFPDNSQPGSLSKAAAH